MTDTRLQWVAAITTALLSVILIGGSVAGWLLGHDLPQWLAVADGTIITAAFAGGAFFAVGRAGEAQTTALSDMTSKYHELAMTGATATSPAPAAAVAQKGGE